MCGCAVAERADRVPALLVGADPEVGATAQLASVPFEMSMLVVAD
jgi:hypothetical protein